MLTAVFVCVAMETMVTSERRRSYHEPGKDLGWREINKQYNKQENLRHIAVRRAPSILNIIFKFKLYHNISCSIRFSKQMQVPSAGLIN